MIVQFYLLSIGGLGGVVAVQNTVVVAVDGHFVLLDDVDWGFRLLEDA